ncbi:MAG: FTR1 family iron permease [Spirochaetaceae bacterium]|jgi:high-affinity iron transporter|nr:FTR1 family iron permease [Spirochaetaceae bacterium]
MGRKSAAALLAAFVWSTVATPVFAASWNDTEGEIRLVLSESYYRYVAGNAEEAIALVDAAFADYQATGFEEQVRAEISEARAQNIEDWMDYVKVSILEGKSQQEMRGIYNELLHLMRVTAGRLDGEEEPAAAARQWTKIAGEMAAILDSAAELYASGNPQEAKERVDEAYFQFYEKVGFEKIVMSSISGARAAQVEYQFSAVKKAINKGVPVPEVKAELDALSGYLKEDAAQLDGREENAVVVFISSLLIILREGFEAILIVGAIIAYLLKSGNKRGARPVYLGSLFALAASVVMAWILNRITSTAGGQNQEIIEGVTMLIAVAVLFYVSNWMLSKSEAEAWRGYIEEKARSSIDTGSMFSLAFAAFLAVFREGAETILFYQALLASTKSYINMIWLGLGVGAAALVVVYILIRVVSIKLPLKPFFLGTSVLLFVMAVTFTGNGVKELQEGNVIGVTPVPGIASVDILGIYPTLETLIPQAILLALAVALFVVQIRKAKNVKEKAL